jgi:3-phosphoshikimate 1-carboxyvinyltransferase
MRLRVEPGSRLESLARVPGDKSIAHRWLILAVTARGSSVLEDLPGSLDVASTALCLARISQRARPALEAWARKVPVGAKGHGSTWNLDLGEIAGTRVEVEGEGWDELSEPAGQLDCGNSGTSMRLLCGVLASAPFSSTLVGDESLSRRPMERVAEPLRKMGAGVSTTDGHPPVSVSGARLHGIQHSSGVPSAQVKGSVLLAGLRAEGETSFTEPAPTRDHTERALAALGAPVSVEGPTVSISAFSHGGFSGTVPGDPSSAAFLIAAAALTGSEMTIADVCLNPTRTRFLDVMGRMGVITEQRVEREAMGEPVGVISVAPSGAIEGTDVDADEIPLVIDEVPVIAALAAHARSRTRFERAGELRNKESDRLSALVAGIEGLGGSARAEGDDLIIGGGGLDGGAVGGSADHRIEMALAVSALAARSDCLIDGIEAADVSFPGFAGSIAGLGAKVEVLD